MSLEQREIRLLSQNEIYRSKDRELILAIWEQEGLVLTEEQKRKFLKVSSPESIRRTRQKIQERGQYLPDANTQKRRKALANQTRQIVREEKKPMVQASFINQGANPWLNS